MESKADTFTRTTLVVHPDFAGMADFVASLPARFLGGEGEVIHHGRNELRLMRHEGRQYVVKSFRRPNPVNSLVYGALRSSKAHRSYEHALLLLRAGIGTPQPVAYLDIRRGPIFTSSFYVSLPSPCQHTYGDIFSLPPDSVNDVARAVGRTTALMHERGFLHKDYSQGNILFSHTDDGRIELEIVDLNRMRFGPVSMAVGCRNFARLPATPRICRIMAWEYALARGYDIDKCYDLMRASMSRRYTMPPPPHQLP